MSRDDKKVYIITVTGKNKDGEKWEQADYCKAENEQVAIEQVKAKDRKYTDLIDTFTYTAKVREDTTKDDMQKWLLFNSLDKSIDDAVWHVEHLANDMAALAERLKFKRESATYNTFGEIQGAASSVELFIGKITALKELYEMTGRFAERNDK